MSAADRFLSFSGPARREPGKDAVPTQPVGLKAWLEALPMANPGVAARMLFNAVKEINGYHIEPGNRLKLLDLLRGPVKQVTVTLDKQVLNMPFPLPAQKRQFGEVSRDFQIEIAHGYRLVLIDLMRGRDSVPFLKGGLVIGALARALIYLREALLKCYLCYSAVPPLLWADLHRLARFADALGLLDKVAEDDQAVVRGKATIGEFYLQPVLLSLANPYRLSHRELTDLSLALEQWSKHATLAAPRRGGEGFPIQVDVDIEPGRAVGGDDPGIVWAVETEPLARLLRESAESPKTAIRSKRNEPLAFDAEFLLGLAGSYGEVAERGFERLPARHQLQTVIGLDAVHFMVAGRMDFQSFLRATGEVPKEIDARAPASNWNLAGEQFRPSVIHARVLDQSLGGYRVMWDTVDSVRAKVGEIVGLSTGSDDDQDQQWMVGVLRWLRVHASAQIEVGIELLSRRVRAVSLRAPSGKMAIAQRSLRLSPLKAGGFDSTVVLPGLITACEHALTLSELADFDFSDDPSPKQLRLGELIEGTGLYSHFAIEPASDGVVPAPVVVSSEPAWNIL
jgi:cyclic-di-GMP-binding protein